MAIFSNPSPDDEIIKKVETFYKGMMGAAQHYLATALNGEAPEMMKKGALNAAQKKADAARYAAFAAAGAAKEVLSVYEERQAMALVHEAEVMWQLIETELRRRRRFKAIKPRRFGPEEAGTWKRRKGFIG
jgi:ABC-type sugar transport system ATPase subunit